MNQKLFRSGSFLTVIPTSFVHCTTLAGCFNYAETLNEQEHIYAELPGCSNHF